MLESSNIPDGGKRISYGDGRAIREPTTGKGRFDLISPYALKRLAIRLEGGGCKYPLRNWERGMDFSRCVDSALRHINQYIMGMEDEDHLAAAMFNIMAVMHYEEMEQLELDDMPHFERKRIEKTNNRV